MSVRLQTTLFITSAIAIITAAHLGVILLFSPHYPLKAFGTGLNAGVSVIEDSLADDHLAKLRRDLLLSELAFFAIGTTVAVAASKHIARPVEENYRRSEELSELKTKAEHASAAKSTFLASTSHEMRTPLNAIIGLSELQLLEQHDAATRADLTRIHHAGRTLLDIVNDILDISKIESGRFGLIATDYDVADLINDAVTMSMVRMGSKPIEFDLHIDEDLPTHLFGDELRVKQIFNNLLSNAFKYTKEGTVTWRVGFERCPASTPLDADVVRSAEDVAAPAGQLAEDTEQRAAAGDTEQPVAAGIAAAAVGSATQPAPASAAGSTTPPTEGAPPTEGICLVSSVTDTGIGIKPEDIEKLFFDYNQVDVKNHRCIEGTGLGLAITRRLLEAMGGSIEVQSVYGEGTTFSVRIPQGFVTDEPLGAQTVVNLRCLQHSADARDPRGVRLDIQLPHLRVLVVDDNQTNLAVAQGMLGRYGIKADCVDSGAKALELVRAGTPVYQAIFMDHLMPGMDGIETFEQIRGLGTAYATSVPIVALTANAINGNAEMFERKGFAAFLSKPIDFTRLDVIVRRLLCDERASDFAELNALGIDVAGGLARLGGDVEGYLSILRLYRVETASLLTRLRAFGAERLDEYAVVVHGIKGSSRGIGAEAVAAEAEKLEAAAKAGDARFVQDESVTFFEQAEALITGMEKVLGPGELQENAPSDPGSQRESDKQGDVCDFYR
jgi:signal transduction histidine kinase/HPt (histidine-containing phosphotransfer) domain-containing protein/AmiR/NasT family two-component response regulator